MNDSRNNPSAGQNALQHFMQGAGGRRLVFFLFAWLFLGLYNSEFLYKIQQFNLFIGHDRLFLANLTQQQGGLLVYAGRYLTQFFYFPLVGALMAAALLSLLELAVAHMARLQGYKSLLHFLPSMLLLLAQTTTGYYLYLHWEPSFPFVAEIGMLLVVGALALYRRTAGKPVLRAATALLLPVAVYAVSGSFAWIVLCGMALETWRTGQRSPAVFPTLLMAVSLAGCITAGYRLFFAGGHAMLFRPLPDAGFIEPFGITLLAVLATIWLTARRSTGAALKPAAVPATGWRPLLITAVGCAVTAFASYRDANFRTELRLQRLFEQQAWDMMVETADQVKHPTRTISAYRAMALAYSSTYSLGDNFFDFNFDYLPVKCRKEVPERMLYFADFELCAAVPNSAFRWNAEYAAQYGFRPATLKAMTMAALVNRELDLATKYLKILNQTTFHKIWALKTTHYLNDIHTLYDVPFYRDIIDRMPSEDTIEDFNGITHLFSYIGEDAEMYERALVTALYYKRIDTFCAKLGQLPGSLAQNMPVYFQEAVAFAGLSVDPSYLEKYDIPAVVLSNVREFQRQLNATENWEDAKRDLKAQFGRTIPYYMVFSEAADYNFPETGTGTILY
ncbi:MAG: DUF6057 family protein [Bacteroidales bacterium]|nr:DUF6057 family protein [Bacteroidales bacterium]